MNPRLKKFLIVCGYVLLFCAAFCALFYLYYFYGLLYNVIYNFVLAITASVILAVIAAEVVTPLIGIIASLLIIGIHLICSHFAEKISCNYQSFKNESNDFNFSEVYKDPTIELKDKILFFLIHSIYCIQFPFLYLASQVSNSITSRYVEDGRIIIPLMIIHSILTVPVAILELIKYPLIKLFSPLGLNVKQLSFLFNVSDVGTGSQSVHTRSFENSVIKCAKELKEKHGSPSNELDKEFKDSINSLTNQQKQMIAPYLRLDGYAEGMWVSWRDSKTGLTLTQAINLVLTAAREQSVDVGLLKSILLVRFEESNRQCGPGMLNRIIYALSSFEAKNNFTAEINSQVYERMPSITEEFLRSYKGKNLKILKDNFDNFYSEGDMDPEIKGSIDRSMEEAKQFVFNKLYVDYYNRYGQEVGRGPIKQKLKELITDGDIKEAVSAIIDDVEIPAEPSTCFEKVKAFFGGHARFSAA